MSIVFMGTPDLARESFRRVVEAGFPVVGAFCQPDRPKGRSREAVPPPVKSFAAARNIEVFQPRRLGRSACGELARLAPDLVIVAAYGLILPRRALAIPRLGCVNVHASLLPAYRGAAPIQWAIACGETRTGVTLMQMDEGLDTGDILVQRECAIEPHETAAALHDRLAALGADLLVEALPDLLAGRIPARPQDERLASHAPKLTRAEGLLDWTRKAGEIANRVRGFHPWPGTHTYFRGRQLKVFPPLLVREELDGDFSPGTVTEISAAGVGVACGEGGVVFEQMQVEGRRRLTADEFVQGTRLRPGETLGQPGSTMDECR